MIWCFSNRGDKVTSSMCHFKENGFGLFFFFFFAWGALKWIQHSLKKVLKLSQMVTPPSPSPSPASAKISCHGANKSKNNVFDDFPSFLLKRLKKGPFDRYCLMSKGVLKKKTIYGNYSSRFPEGSQKRKSNNDDKHSHGQEKRRPSTLCWGKKATAI